MLAEESTLNDRERNSVDTKIQLENLDTIYDHAIEQNIVRRVAQKDGENDDYDQNTPSPVMCEPWTEKSEDLLRQFIVTCEDKSAKHMEASYFNNKLLKCFTFPSVVIPTISSPLVLFLETETEAPESSGNQLVTYLAAILFALTSLCTIVLQVGNYRQHKEEHFQYARAYEAVRGEIVCELTKHIKYRNNVEVVIQAASLKMDGLREKAPLLPSFINNKKTQQNK